MKRAGGPDLHTWTDAELVAAAAVLRVLRPLDSEARMNALVIAVKAVIEPELRAVLMDRPRASR